MESQQPKNKAWRGEVTADLSPSLSADKAWSLLGDFCGIHQWIPTLDTCRRVDGVNGQRGCVRYCCGSAIKSHSGEKVAWSKERLLAVDNTRRFYAYEVVDNNLGIGGYYAKLEVVADGAGGRCRVQWSFAAEPIKGWTLEGFVSYLALRVRTIAQRLEEAAS